MIRFVQSMKSKRTVFLLLLFGLMLVSCQNSAIVQRDFKVPSGVTLDDRHIGEKSAAELQDILEDLAMLGKVEARDAALDPQQRPGVQGVYPGSCGRQLDLEATLLAVRDAQPHSKLRTCWQEVAPKTSWKAFGDRVPYRGAPDRQELAFAVNVAWGDEAIPGLLDLLQQEGIAATWFLTGRWADLSPGLARRIAEQGHELGNHGYSDPHMLQISDEEIVEEIQRTQTAIYEATGVEPRLFSPPYLELDQRILSIAAAQGLHTVMYQVDTADWLLPGPELIAERVLDGLCPGAIILCHPTEQTAEGLKRIIDAARRDGYRFVTIGELIDESR